MTEPNSKKLITDYFPSSKAPGLTRKSGFPALSDDLQGKLINVGRNARKAVSDGYKYKGTSLPSYKGLTIGPTDPGAFEFANIDGSVISSKISSMDSNMSLTSQTNHPINLNIQEREKRSRELEEEEEDTDIDLEGEDTDVEDEEEIKRIIQSRPKAQIRTRIHHHNQQQQHSQRVFIKSASMTTPSTTTSSAVNNNNDLMVDSDFEDAEFLVSKENL